MKLLLDTHILLWMLAKPDNLSAKECQIISQASLVFFSPISLFEVGLKPSMWAEYGISHVEDVFTWALESNVREMPLLTMDTMLSTQLPFVHRDPVDRLLIAQSHNRQCHLLTADSKIALYNMPYVIQV